MVRMMGGSSVWSMAEMGVSRTLSESENMKERRKVVVKEARDVQNHRVFPKENSIHSKITANTACDEARSAVGLFFLHHLHPTLLSACASRETYTYSKRKNIVVTHHHPLDTHFSHHTSYYYIAHARGC